MPDGNGSIRAVRERRARCEPRPRGWPFRRCRAYAGGAEYLAFRSVLKSERAGSDPGHGPQFATNWSMIAIVRWIREGGERRRLRAKLGAMPARATSKEYRERVQRIRTLAEGTTFPGIKKELLQAADEFERQAAQAESHEIGSERRSSGTFSARLR